MNDLIIATCPSCGEEFEYSPEDAGIETQCPHCESPLILPSAEEKAEDNPLTLNSPEARIEEPLKPMVGELPSLSASVGGFKKSKFIVGLSIAALIFGILYLGSPYWNVFQLRKAVQRNDAIFVSDHVDFPQLRESLKATITAQVVKESTKNDTNGFEALGGGTRDVDG